MSNNIENKSPNNANDNAGDSAKDNIDNEVDELPPSDNPATLGNTMANEEDMPNPDTKNVSLVGKDAENMLKQQANANPTSNPAKKNTKKNNTTNNINNNIKRNSNNQTINQSLTQKQPLNTNEAETGETNTTANTNLETNTAMRTNTSKDKMISLNKLTMNLLNHQIVLKLFHFQTELYGAHKASDAYLEKYSQTMDKFLEIAQGIYGKITLKKYTLTGSSHTDENIIKHLDGMITLLREKIDDVLEEYTDLINVRDELVGDAEQLKYLLTFK